MTSKSKLVYYKENLNRSMVVFRKESNKEENNSVILVKSEKKNYSFNLLNDDEFFNNKHLSKNILLLKEKVSNEPELNDFELIEIKDSEKKTRNNKVICKLTSEDENDKEHIHKDKESKAYHQKKNLYKISHKPTSSLIFSKSIYCRNVFENDDFNNPQKKFKINNSENVIISNDSIGESIRKFNFVELNSKDTVIEHYPFKICFICDEFSILHKSISAECRHPICTRCFKAYYEEKIEEGVKTFKCAIFKCNYFFTYDVVRSLISVKHIINLENNIDKVRIESPIASGSRNYINYLSQTKDFLSIKNNSDPIKKLYTQKHGLAITNNDSFLHFQKAKDQYCSICFEPALYGKGASKFVKCLNCLFKFCKYCLKEFKADHLNINSFNYCKVYFRKKIFYEPSEKMNIFKEFMINIILYVLGYFVFLLGIFNYISIFYFNNLLEIESNVRTKKSFLITFLLYLIYVLLMIVSIIFFLPFILFLIPYFSLTVFLSK